ncbi:N-terminal acetyltransferase B complex catalytic subunit NAA20 [Citrus sinensis]|nr:N-terminal acetyltransferase B complex catalytic subunit NAA20 [Citrus sinensis]
MGHHRSCKNGLWKPIGVTISYLAVPFNVSFRARSFFVPNSRKMTTIRRFCCNDLLRFTSVNLDHLTETVSCSSFDDCNRSVMGKVEGQGESWHGHVTAVTVSPEYRRQQLAKKLMNLLEDISDKIDKAYFVDLFVRASNTPAIKMYEKLGYVIYRRVLRYYSGEEDGLDMRKALSRDVEKKSIIPLKRPVTPDELEYD